MRKKNKHTSRSPISILKTNLNSITSFLCFVGKTFSFFLTLWTFKLQVHVEKIAQIAYQGVKAALTLESYIQKELSNHNIFKSRNLLRPTKCTGSASTFIKQPREATNVNRYILFIKVLITLVDIYFMNFNSSKSI